MSRWAANTPSDPPPSARFGVNVHDRRRLQLALLKLLCDGWTKTDACRRLGITTRMVTRWTTADADFGERYRAARVEQAHALADRALEIADEPVEKGDPAAVQRNRLRVDALKWMASKIAPSAYGDSLCAEINVARGGVVVATVNAARPNSKDSSLSNVDDGVSATRARGLRSQV